MDKRTILAVALSFLVLLFWSRFTSKTQHIENKGFTTESSVLTQNEAKPIAIAQVEPETDITSLFNYEQENFTVIFIEPKAAIKEVIFKNHQVYKFALQEGFFLSDPSLCFQKESVTSDTVT
ncbi:MAG: hypothetical protein QMD94_05040, partial [Candidatus Omnitrophota bacterium]|nr:hypothetical protein [Candidatus Omnitrophota bacterium]